MSDFAARLYVEADLGTGGRIRLDAGQQHYLKNVLRLEPGARLVLFNGRHGEWSGRLARFDRHGGEADLEEQRRPQQTEPDLWLVFAPLKRARIDYLVEKATELGASRLVPVHTRHTILSRLNADRLSAHAREAAEQTERLSLPALAPMLPLATVLDGWDAERALLVCDETGAGPSLAEVLADFPAGPAAILTGPEGGFAPDELERLRAAPFVRAASLGPRVLRADTAALAALAVFQAVRGDWGSARPSWRSRAA